jgi:hypothetical protein
VVVLDGKCAVGCGCGIDCLCWTELVLYIVCLERIGCV